MKLNSITRALFKPRRVATEPKRNDMQSGAVEQHEKQLRRAERAANDKALWERQKKWD